MRGKRSRLTLVGMLVLALGVTAGLTVGSADAKKTKKTKVFNETKTVNLPIPDASSAPSTRSTPVEVQFNLGKKFKGKVVGDVNLTFQTTGSAAGAASDLSTYLIAPNRRTGIPFENIGFNLASIGPLTLDDDTSTELCDTLTPPCADPLKTLNYPWAGTANTLDQDDDMTPFTIFNGVPMKGTWTFGIFDESNGLTSTLNKVGIQVTAAKPVS